MDLTTRTLRELGATRILEVPLVPQTEEEFSLIRYESEAPIVWTQYIELYTQLRAQHGIQLLRMHRNRLLQNSDWIMTVDVYQTISNKEEWIAYRQLLRDLPTSQLIWKTEDELDIQQMIPTPPDLRKGE